MLRELGFEISDSRYPYTYHHDFARMCGKGESRADIAQKMSAFQDKYIAKFGEHHGKEAYEAALRLGAILYLARQHPFIFMRAILSEYQYKGFRSFVLGLFVKIIDVDEGDLLFAVKEPLW